MLKSLDALWIPSRHGAAAVARDVSVPVHIVPAPVMRDIATVRRRPAMKHMTNLARRLDRIGWQPLAILPRIQDEMNRASERERRGLSRIIEVLFTLPRPTLFVTVLNVHDYRKQHRPMLKAFATLAQAHPGALLLVKCLIPAAGRHAINDLLLHEQIATPGERPSSIVSDRIWITRDVLTRAEMTSLYDLAAFYICAAYAEGQNLPLLEAMGRGVVPVSADHTAMADYIRPDNAVLIRSTRGPFDIRLSCRYGLYGLDTNHVSAADALSALNDAMTLDDAAYAARSAASLATVRDQYGTNRLTTALRHVVEGVGAQAAAHG